MASQETTSALLGNACFLLSRQPAYWQKIRDAIANYELDDFDFDMLLSLKTVQHILHETLRLYPIFPLMGRNAIRDTTLPVGGGPTQSGPVFVAKDTVVTMSYFALHRDPAVYGDDAAEFRPERWETIQPTYWEFMGFGGGNRECLGQQKVLVEAAYVLVRLAKEFEALESRDKEDWVGEMKLTCKSKNGCKVALYREGSTAQS
jgi:cytochrome P450